MCGIIKVIICVKGEFLVKKIYLMMVAVFMTALIPLHAVAQTSELTAKNNNGEVKVSITNSVETQNADEILPGIRECSEAITHSLTLKADADVVASLKLMTSEVATGDKIPLNNYDIIIKNEKEEVIYDSKNAIMSKRNDSYKEMPFGNILAGEEKTYSITYMLIDTQTDVSTISLAISAKAYLEPTQAPENTPKPKYTMEDEFIFDWDQEQEKIDNEVAESTDPSATLPPSKPITTIKKVCGEDIPAGRFSVTGNGNLKISSSTGSVKSEAIISENPVEGKSVKTAVVLLESGDVLDITPLEGEEKARLKFNKINTTTPAASATTNDKNGDRKANIATPTPKNPAQAAKTNPKTGDDGVGILIGVAAFAVVAFVALEIIKRKKRNNS